MGDAAAARREQVPDRGGIAVPIGRDLRALRKSKGITLSELALGTGRSTGYLSQVERGLSDLSVTDLGIIAGLLGVPLAWFLIHDEAPERERGRIVRAHSRRRIGNAGDGLSEELLSPDLGGAFEMIRSVFAPGAESAGTALRDTEEAGYLAAGELDLWIGGREFNLKAGDSFRLDREPLRWRNPGGEPAVAIWIIAPPVY